MSPAGKRRWSGGRVVHLAAEYWPYARTGGLAEAARGLARAQVRGGLDVTVIMPLHRAVRAGGTALTPVGDPYEVTMGDRSERAQLYAPQDPDDGPEVLFVGHDAYFDRGGIYGEFDADYPDNHRRFAFFSRAALDALPRHVPDAGVLHAHDWHTALSAIYLRYTLAGYPGYDRIAAVLTVHNAAFQGVFPPTVLADIGLPDTLYDWRVMEWYGHANVLKGSLTFADMVTTVSPNHAAELRTPEGGFGLHQHYQHLNGKFVGILNGIDHVLWDPATDPMLAATYDEQDMAPKERSKRAAQRRYGLPQRKRIPLIAMSARLVQQKGLDLVLAPGLLERLDAQFVFLGRGEARYEAALVERARAAPDRIAAPLEFDERLEHRLLAGSDMLLMPSQFEPCGLTQMRSQRYGSLPVVRRVGGLSDTVQDHVTGFAFDAYDPDALEATLRRAIVTYQDRPAWETMMRNAMRQDFTWGRSERAYRGIYRLALAARG